MIHRATLKQFTTRGVLVEIPDFGVGQYFGPCQVLANLDLETEQDVIVAVINNVKEDIVVLGPVTSETQEFFIDGNDDGEAQITIVD